jgi:adenosylcobinamide kinase/adenosylcobinamide-phosphate guanylyltransferase
MLILVTGGSRSGKSGFAVQRAAAHPQPRVFLATAQVADEEMRSRIEAHRKSRPPEWGLVEEPREVARALTRILEGAGVVIVDCVTLWVSNLILADETMGEKEVADRAEELAVIASGSPVPVIVVTNEVGSGVVPDNALARRFRDCAGRANQVLARWANEVYLMVSGLPMALRTGKELE